MKKVCSVLMVMFSVLLLVKCDSGSSHKKNPVIPDFSGDESWARSVSAGTLESRFSSVADSGSGIYAVGVISEDGDYTFGTQTVNGSSNNEYNPVLVKYDTEGNAVWATSTADGPLVDAESGFASVAVGSDGIYVAGTIETNTAYTFGDQVVNGFVASSGNALLVKYDTEGNAIWARSTSGGDNSSEFYSVSAGSDGIYAAGTIREDGTYRFGTTTVAGPFATHKNAVLVKYDTEGNAVWAKSATVAPERSGFDSVAAGSDGIYAAGFIRGSDEFSFDEQHVQGMYNGFNALLVKYDTDGNAVWAKTVSTASDSSYFYSVAVSGTDIYAAGYFYTTGPVEFGDQSVTGASDGLNAVIVKYDTEGNAVWARSTSAGSGGSCLNTVTTGGGRVYAGGYIYGSNDYTFGDQTVNGFFDTGNNAVLIKYDTDGNAIWARSTAAGNDQSTICSVSAGISGLFTAGFIAGSSTYTFGDVDVAGTSSTDNNALLVKYE